MNTGTAARLELLRDEEDGNVFPRHLLADCDTALVVFCAGFYGRQDAYWIADAGLTATCVDEDEDKMVAMLSLYPTDWSWYVGDAYDLPDYLGDEWDIVTCDPWTQHFQKCANHLTEWCAIARRAVVIGTGPSTVVDAPDGWKVTETRKRSDYGGGVYWTVLEPA